MTGDFSSQWSVTRSFDFFFDAWINGWVHIREAGDLRRYRAHYDVIVMFDTFGEQAFIQPNPCYVVAERSGNMSMSQ